MHSERMFIGKLIRDEAHESFSFIGKSIRSPSQAQAEVRENELIRINGEWKLLRHFISNISRKSGESLSLRNHKFLLFYMPRVLSPFCVCVCRCFC